MTKDIFLLCILLSTALQAQEVKWTKVFDFQNVYYGPELSCLDKDSTGSLYIGLRYSETIPSSFDYGTEVRRRSNISKLSPNGQLLWKILEGDTTYHVDVTALKIHSEYIFIDYGFTKRALSGDFVTFKPGGLNSMGILDSTIYSYFPHLGILNTNFQGNWKLVVDLKNKYYYNEKVLATTDGIYFAYSDDHRYLQKYNFNGNLQWQVQIPLFYRDLKADEDGNVYLVGFFIDSGALIKIKPNGEVAWIYSNEALVFHSCVIENGIVHLAGSDSPSSGSGYDLRITYTQINSNSGELIKSTILDLFSEKPYTGTHIIKHKENIYIGGKVGAQYSKGFIAKLQIEEPAYQTAIKEINKTSGSLKLFPNPATKAFTLEGDITGADIEIHDNACRLVYSQSNLKHNSINIELNSQSKGVYFIKIIKGDAVEVKKIMLE